MSDTNTREHRDAGPELVPAKMHLASPAAPVTGKVVRNERCTASKKAAGFVRHIEFDVSGTPLAGSFVSRQSFGVLPPGVDAKALLRAVLGSKTR